MKPYGILMGPLWDSLWDPHGTLMGPLLGSEGQKNFYHAPADRLGLKSAFNRSTLKVLRKGLFLAQVLLSIKKISGDFYTKF